MGEGKNTVMCKVIPLKKRPSRKKRKMKKAQKIIACMLVALIIVFATNVYEGKAAESNRICTPLNPVTCSQELEVNECGEVPLNASYYEVEPYFTGPISLIYPAIQTFQMDLCETEVAAKIQPFNKLILSNSFLKEEAEKEKNLSRLKQCPEQGQICYTSSNFGGQLRVIDV